MSDPDGKPLSQDREEACGSLSLEQIRDGSDFWALIEELINDKSGFICNRGSIVEAYRDQNLYGIRMKETDLMSYDDPLFCPKTFWLLPSFCIFREGSLSIIWTHTRARRKGYARFLVEALNPTEISYPFEESLGFWTKLGFVKETNERWVKKRINVE